MAEKRPFDAFLETHAEAETVRAAQAHSSVVCAVAPGMPVIFVSDAFEAHTGYSQSEVMGRSLGLLQGPDTEPEAVAEFRRLIDAGEAGTVRITNYRKDKTPFVHECEMRPIRDDTGAVSHFIAIQRVV